MQLSVLDQSPVSAGSNGTEALRHSLDLAARAERLGYTRYWMAEHHGTSMLACTSPEVVLGAMGAVTTRIRIGSGGVMLPHYSPLKVAEAFSTLSALFPGRVDLGLGRAAGTDPLTAFALQRDRRHAAPDDFPQQLVELLGHLTATLPAGHAFARLAALAGLPERPAPWLLGSSAQSSVWAAELGLPYAFADFINPAGAPLARRYRETFQPSGHLDRPRVIVATWALCAETDEEAERLAASARMAFAQFLQGQPGPVPPVDVALRWVADHPHALGALADRRRWTVGGPESVRAVLESVGRDYGADEIMIVTITHDHGARCRSYELIANAFASLGSTPDEREPLVRA